MHSTYLFNKLQKIHGAISYDEFRYFWLLLRHWRSCPFTLSIHRQRMYTFLHVRGQIFHWGWAGVTIWVAFRHNRMFTTFTPCKRLQVFLTFTLFLLWSLVSAWQYLFICKSPSKSVHIVSLWCTLYTNSICFIIWQHCGWDLVWFWHRNTWSGEGKLIVWAEMITLTRSSVGSGSPSRHDRWAWDEDCRRYSQLKNSSWI